MMNLVSFAHSENLHTADTSELVHQLTQPLVALPLYFGVQIALYLGLKHHAPKRLLVGLMSYNFAVGFLSFTASPIVAVIAITMGMISALVISFSLIAGEN